MQVEGTGSHTSETNESCFCMPPDAFNTVDVVAAFGKFIFAMINTKVLAVTNIDQTVIATPAVRVDDAFQFYLSAYNRLQGGFRAIWNDFSINVTVPLKDAKDNRFAVCATASFAFDATRTKERFVNFNLSREGRLSLTIFDQALPDFCEISINRVAI